MSTISVTNVLTGNGTTDLTISTGNSTAASIVVNSSNDNINVNGSITVTSNVSVNGYIINPKVNDTIYLSNGISNVSVYNTFVNTNYLFTNTSPTLIDTLPNTRAVNYNYVIEDNVANNFYFGSILAGIDDSNVAYVVPYANTPSLSAFAVTNTAPLVSAFASGSNLSITFTSSQKWTAVSNIGTAIPLVTANHVVSGVYGNGVHVVSAFFSTNIANTAYTSNSGNTWTAAGLPSAFASPVYQKSLAFGNGVFVLLGSNATVNCQIATSPTGATWTVRTAGNTTTGGARRGGVVWSGNTFVAVTANTTNLAIQSSTDGVTWTNRAPGNTNYSGSAGPHIAYGNNTWVVVSNNIVLTSADGQTWSQAANGPWVAAQNTSYLAYVANSFLFVPNTTVNSYISQSGTSWQNIGPFNFNTVFTDANTNIIYGVRGANLHFGTGTITNLVLANVITHSANVTFTTGAYFAGNGVAVASHTTNNALVSNGGVAFTNVTIKTTKMTIGI